jgi:hypothetical protein
LNISNFSHHIESYESSDLCLFKFPEVVVDPARTLLIPP